MPKKAGRPPIPLDQQRKPAYSVRLNPAERKPIDEAIKASGLGSSEWCKKALQHVANNGICIT